MNTRRLAALLAAALLAALGACSSDEGGGDDATVRPSDTTTEPTEAQPSTPPPLPVPEGYPQVVEVASLPFQVRSWYEMNGHTQAVAVAPGVWGPMTPGATVESVVLGRVFEGFCPSVKAYEDEYRPGEGLGVTCW